MGSIDRLNDFISKGTPWEDVPIDVRSTIGDNRESYEKSVKLNSLSHQMRYEEATARHLVSKPQYYAELLNYLRQTLRLYPYQFASYIVNELKVQPFQFYTEMMVDIMKSEKSYDILPNFTAADIVRLMGIGRNQYIDIMNKARAKKWTWRFNKGIVKDMLPTNPIKLDIEYWWLIEPCPISPQDMTKIYSTISSEEQLAVDTIRNLYNSSPVGNQQGAIPPFIQASRLPHKAVLSLYRRGLIQLHVPIDDEDYIIVPPLKGFVMNRTTDDYFEKLLYDVLVSIDERTSVSQLASILEVNIELVRIAVSLYCRLGFAKKKMPLPPTLEVDQDKYHPSWVPYIQEYHDQAVSSSITSSTDSISNVNSSSALSTASDAADAGVSNTYAKRIGFLYDSGLTAYLMMGNLSESLKSHAVTLFEVGKMQDEMLDNFLEELDKVSMSGVEEGEAARYYIHAINLRKTLRFLRRNSAFSSIPDCDGAIDLVRCESLNNLDASTRMRILDKNYSILIAMAPLAYGTLTLPTCIPRFYGPPIPQISTPWFKLYLYASAAMGPPTALFVKGSRVKKLPKLFKNCEKVTICGWSQEPNAVHIRTLIQPLNELLAHHPSVIQAHEFANKTTDTFDIPFPLPKDLLSDNAYGLRSANEAKQVRDAIERIIEKLHLQYSFGYVKMMRITAHSTATTTTAQKKSDEGLHQSSSETSEDAERADGTETPQRISTKIVPVDLVFGIPLSGDKINSAICESIADGLFLKENIATHTTNMRLLCTEFLEFIDQNLDIHLRLDAELATSPFPTNTVVFDGEKLYRVPATEAIDDLQ